MGYIRFLLAMTVLLAHLSVPIQFSGFGGANSVEAFFFISGFLIAAILSNTYRSTRNFYLNRFLRIFPMYWVVLIISLFVFQINSPQFKFFAQGDVNDLNLSQILFLIFTNVFIIASDILVFLNLNSTGEVGFVGFNNIQVTGTDFLVVAPIWSVSLELFFYLIAPILFKSSTRKLLLIIGLLLFVRTSLYFFGINDDPWTYRFFPFEMPIFLLGVMLFRYSTPIRKRVNGSKTLKWFIHPFSVSLQFLAFGFFRSEVSSPRPFELFYLLFLVGSILVFARNTKFNNSIGRLSYPIYIVHFPVIYCFQEFQDKFSERFVNSELVWNGLQILVVILLSYILIFVTSPVEKIRARLRF